MKRIATAMLITLAALAGALWWGGGSNASDRTVGKLASSASSPLRPPIDLVLEYDPPPRPSRASRAPSASSPARSAPAAAPPSPTPAPPSRAVAEYLPPGDGALPPRALVPEPPPAPVAVSAAAPEAATIEETELPPEKAALLRRLLAIRERIAASD